MNLKLIKFAKQYQSGILNQDLKANYKKCSQIVKKEVEDNIEDQIWQNIGQSWTRIFYNE